MKNNYKKTDWNFNDTTSENVEKHLKAVKEAMQINFAEARELEKRLEDLRVEVRELMKTEKNLKYVESYNKQKLQAV
jgi:prefoldin subunit 5